MSATATVATTAVRSPVVLPVLPPPPLVHHDPRPFFFNGAVRPVYRHSIVPGGVYSAEEVQAAIVRDPIVAAHYEKLDSAKVVETVLDKPRAVYVSYRIGHRTRWTARKVVLPAGERLLTDGTTVVRARCGNLVSETGGEQGVADASGERFDPAELDEQVPSSVAPGPQLLAVASGPAPFDVLPAFSGTPLMLEAAGPEAGPSWPSIGGAWPIVVGGGVSPSAQIPTTPGTTTGTVFPTTTTGELVVPPTTTTGTVSTTTTGTVPLHTTTGTNDPPETTTTGTLETTTGLLETTTGLLEPLTTTTDLPTTTSSSATSGTVPEPSRLGLLVLAWVAFRYRRRQS